MSTKRSVKWKERTNEGPGYHLYNDVLDADDDPPVYLRIDGVHVELETIGESGASVTIVLPRGIARELGLVHDVELTGDAALSRSPS